jgi:thiol-disulfide isomerase/thioredoxin
MSLGLWIVVAAVVAALIIGAYRALTDGRFRGTHRVAAGPAVTDVSGHDTPTDTAEASATAWAQLGEAAAVDPGERATLVQFSSAFCAPCRATRRILADVAAGTPGVVHVEIDAEHHLEVVRRLGILRTPTTLILDADGNEVARAAGAPRKEQVLSALPASSYLET